MWTESEWMMFGRLELHQLSLYKMTDKMTPGGNTSKMILFEPLSIRPSPCSADDTHFRPSKPTTATTVVFPPRPFCGNKSRFSHNNAINQDLLFLAPNTFSLDLLCTHFFTPKVSLFQCRFKHWSFKAQIPLSIELFCLDVNTSKSTCSVKAIPSPSYCFYWYFYNQLSQVEVCICGLKH